MFEDKAIYAIVSWQWECGHFRQLSTRLIPSNLEGFYFRMFSDIFSQSRCVVEDQQT